MPTLGGLLKKKKTKDSSANEPTPTSPVAEKPPATPVSSKVTEQSGPSPPSSAPTTSTLPSSSTQATSIAPPSESTVAASTSGPMAPATSPVGQSDNSAPVNALVNNTAAAAMADQNQPRTTKGKYTLTDFQIQRTLGTGSFGRVHLVQSKHNQRFYAVKVLKKQQVVKMKQIEHTNDERRMLGRVKHPFLITLWGTFQDSKNLYMVMDFIEGGELFSLLRKSQVRPNSTSS